MWVEKTAEEDRTALIVRGFSAISDLCFWARIILSNTLSLGCSRNEVSFRMK